MPRVAALLLCLRLATPLAPAPRRKRTRLASTSVDEAFRNLSDDQKYEALLLGALLPQQGRPDVDGALRLVDEIAKRDLKAVGPRVLGALVDAAASRKDAALVGEVLRISKRS
eukprot:CAMPEP_0119275868 /NCGR_PEP_ID=MMETSP1329-20130426/14578_1 /TAXON_ID=114041 /ORGANISM="Genus nov. species nov., Strain RCC1024" /LENGTH=112 /DNA_ID=CAMNT_0007276289 /DNA_START=123 /DNA_END=457 /DNA_ORIENTATION=+